MHTAATTGSGVLTPNDAVQLLEELLPAQNKSYQLGLKLKLQPHQVENIHSTYANAEERLLRIIMLFLNQVDPQPTWRVIVDALKSPAINLPQFARAVETAHFPVTTSTSMSEATSKIIPSFLSSVFMRLCLVSFSQTSVLTSIYPSPVLPTSSGNV